MKIFLDKAEFDGKELYYFTAGKKDYFKPVYRIWVNDKLVKRDENGNAYVEMPMRDCQIVEIKNNNLILKQGDKNLFMFEVECGYRGKAEILEIDAYGHDYKSYIYDIYKSERGSTGISVGIMILTTAEKVKIKWKRDGRLYGKARSGTTILYIDGKVEAIEDVDMQELLREM
jgi:hypothetical protein